MNSGLIFDFLKSLEANNNREWFQAHKSLYDKAKLQIEDLTAALITTISQFDPRIHQLQVRDCLFRIYRDVRFSPNKDPYKTHFGIFFNKGGKNSPYAGYYLHIESGKSMIGGGIYMPPADILKVIRQEIFFNPGGFKKILEAPVFQQNFGELSPYQLKKPPKDFPKDFEDIDLLKFTSYVVGKNVDNSFFDSNNPVDEIAAIFKTMYPFIDYLNHAIEMKE